MHEAAIALPTYFRMWLSVSRSRLFAMYRIDARDADALDYAHTAADVPAPEGPLTEQLVWNTLKTVFDPEIPVNNC